MQPPAGGGWRTAVAPDPVRRGLMRCVGKTVASNENEGFRAVMELELIRTSAHAVPSRRR